MFNVGLHVTVYQRVQQWPKLSLHTRKGRRRKDNAGLNWSPAAYPRTHPHTNTLPSECPPAFVYQYKRWLYRVNWLIPICLSPVLHLCCWEWMAAVCHMLIFLFLTSQFISCLPGPWWMWLFSLASLSFPPPPVLHRPPRIQRKPYMWKQTTHPLKKPLLKRHKNK